MPRSTGLKEGFFWKGNYGGKKAVDAGIVRKLIIRLAIIGRIVFETEALIGKEVVIAVFDVFVAARFEMGDEALSPFFEFGVLGRVFL